MNELLRRLFGKPSMHSGADAKARLKVLLVHDEIDLPAAKLDQMKDEILEVVRKYVDYEEAGVSFRLQKESGHVALVSNVPVRRVNARA